jgi:hypothetical protein
VPGIGIRDTGVVLPTLKTDLRMSSHIISGNGILWAVTAKEKPGISPTLVVFVSSSLIRRAHFSFVFLADKLAGCYKSIRGSSYSCLLTSAILSS